MQQAVLDPDRSAAATALIAAHGIRLQRLARRLSICPDDADDAVQRAVEIMLLRAPPLEGGRLLAWMTTVTRREALAVRRSRERLLGSARLTSSPGADPVDRVASELPGPLERATRRERVAGARAALAALKPDERLAIALQALGYSYAEICERCGWTYTKLNRCLAEGRAELRCTGAIP